MRGDLKPAGRQAHSDQVRFIVYVLWLHGLSIQVIGKAVGLRRGQVSGIVGRSEYADRGAMTMEERGARLRELHAIRYDDDTGAALDGGALKDTAFRPQPLGGRQARG